MKRALTVWRYLPSRRFVIPMMVLVSICLGLRVLPSQRSDPPAWHVDPVQKKLVHSYVQSVLANGCRVSFARKEMEAKHSNSTPVTHPFLFRDTDLRDEMFMYPPPFGFLDLKTKLKEVLRLLPTSEHRHAVKGCRRCVIIGNGGILRGLHLGTLLNKFDVVIRLNSGPVRDFSRDVGNRTSIRISYPEGTPKVWEDVDPELQFVAVVYKPVDLKWLSAMITKQKVSLWDWLFFWQKVPDKIPVDSSQFRILNLEIIWQTAIDLLHYTAPKIRLWGWDQNVPTLGVTALNLATYLCDEVSLAGFGYNLNQREAPLHYYEDLPMSEMLKQSMHNVNQETALLKKLVAAGTVTDLTGGVHCSFCPT